jgi:hypothetical protein
MSATSPACAPADSARTDASIEKPAKLPRVSREYEGLDILKVGLHDYPDHDEQIVTLVLRRDGLFDWKPSSHHLVRAASTVQADAGCGAFARANRLTARCCAA